MLQEIITYIIVAFAVAFAIWKIYKKLAGKKKKKVIYKDATYTPQHNCSDCAASCTLRDAVPEIRVENKELCETTVVKTKDS
jgi:large-conductance mechanosensitive channel